MSVIRDYVNTHLMDPLRVYPTEVQNAIIELLIQRLEALYELSIKFPEIVTPSESRIDILRAICQQFKYTIREPSEIKEQVQILNKILDVYKRRGSVDTIENMWKYYGGNLPKQVRVSIPSHKLFRYSVSPYSTEYFYPDGQNKRTGVIDITVSDDVLEISREELLKFLREELVPAGSLINLIIE